MWSDGRSVRNKNYAQGSFARQFSAVLSIQILRILNGRLTQVIELGIGGISTFIWYVQINPLVQVSFSVTLTMLKMRCGLPELMNPSWYPHPQPFAPQKNEGFWFEVRIRLLPRRNSVPKSPNSFMDSGGFILASCRSAESFSASLTRQQVQTDSH